ncbi:MAG: hypothetical protein GC150_01420 [Rhizobiales bacterium]|nr:hypothetical protein [Hyphomicrobiales bacterium]
MSGTIGGANGWLVAAAIVTAATAAIHVILGGKYVARPLLAARELHPIAERHRVAKYTSYYCWHLVTITLLAMAAGYAVAAVRPGAGELAVMCAVLSAGFCLLSIGLILMLRLDWRHFPQWSLFAAAVVLAVVGLT